MNFDDTKKKIVNLFTNNRKLIGSLFVIILVIQIMNMKKFNKDIDSKKWVNQFNLDFNDNNITINDVKDIFTTKSYSGLEKDSTCSDKKWNETITFENEYGLDPTCGNVKYLDLDNKENNLFSLNQNLLELKLRVSNNHFGNIQMGNLLNNNSTVFDSIRLTSKQTFNNDKQHIFVLKAKLPFGKSLWPAWWLTGSDGEQKTINSKWPVNGEIDIIELVNDESKFKNVIHSCKKCHSRWRKINL